MSGGAWVWPAGVTGARDGRLSNKEGRIAINIIAMIAQIIRRSMDDQGSGNRIKATRMKGVTPGQTSHPQPSAAYDAVSRYRLQGVLRAGGMKPATRRQEWGDEQLISANQQCHRPTG